MANEQSATINRSLLIGGLTIGGTNLTVNGDGVQTFEKDIPASTTNGEADFVLDVSTVKAIAIVSNKALTIKTNSTGSPDDTITLAANDVLIWKTGDLAAGLFFTVDVTKLYITNAGSSAAHLKIGAMVDMTPVLGG